MNKCLGNAITVRCEPEAAAATGLSLPGFALQTNSHLCLGVRVQVFGLSAMAGPFGSEVCGITSASLHFDSAVGLQTSRTGHAAFRSRKERYRATVI